MKIISILLVILAANSICSCSKQETTNISKTGLQKVERGILSKRKSRQVEEDRAGKKSKVDSMALLQKIQESRSEVQKEQESSSKVQECKSEEKVADSFSVSYELEEALRKSFSKSLDSLETHPAVIEARIFIDSESWKLFFFNRNQLIRLIELMGQGIDDLNLRAIWLQDVIPEGCFELNVKIQKKQKETSEGLSIILKALKMINYCLETQQVIIDNMNFLKKE